MKTTVDVGIVGLGYWGPNLARNINIATGATLAAVCDWDSERLLPIQELYPKANAYTDFHSMLLKSDLDAVFIATPLESHHALAKACLLAGKHVMIEKPMARSSRDCEELIAIAKEMNLILMVGLTYLFSDAVAKIAEIIKSGQIGDVRHIYCERLNFRNFKQDIDVAWDLAPHDLSILIYVLGELPEQVNCQGRANHASENRDITNITLTFNGERFASIQNSRQEPRKVRRMTFVGTRKVVVYDDLQLWDKIQIHEVGAIDSQFGGPASENQNLNQFNDRNMARSEQCEPLARMCNHFVECIINNHQPISCGARGAEIVRILEACNASSNLQGRAVVISGPRCSLLSPWHEPWNRSPSLTTTIAAL